MFWLANDVFLPLSLLLISLDGPGVEIHPPRDRAIPGVPDYRAVAGTIYFCPPLANHMRPWNVDIIGFKWLNLT